jgi:hypothetical protein
MNIVIPCASDTSVNHHTLRDSRLRNQILELRQQFKDSQIVVVAAQQVDRLQDSLCELSNVTVLENDNFAEHNDCYSIATGLRGLVGSTLVVPSTVTWHGRFSAEPNSIIPSNNYGYCDRINCQHIADRVISFGWKKSKEFAASQFSGCFILDEAAAQHFSEIAFAWPRVFAFEIIEKFIQAGHTFTLGKQIECDSWARVDIPAGEKEKSSLAQRKTAILECVRQNPEFTSVEIAAAVCCDSTYCKKFLKSQGIEVKTAKQIKRERVTELVAAGVLANKEIAEVLHCSCELVSDVRKSLGLESVRKKRSAA